MINSHTFLDQSLCECREVDIEVVEDDAIGTTLSWLPVVVARPNLDGLGWGFVGSERENVCESLYYLIGDEVKMKG